MAVKAQILAPHNTARIPRGVRKIVVSNKRDVWGVAKRCA